MASNIRSHTATNVTPRLAHLFTLNSYCRRTMSIRPQRAFVAKLASTLFLPFALAYGAYQIALLLPGQIRTDYWQNFVSLALLFSASFAVYLIMTTQARFLIRAVSAGLRACVYVLLAMLAGARPNCEEELPFIGQTLNSSKLSSCGVMPNHSLNRSTSGRLVWPRTAFVHVAPTDRPSQPAAGAHLAQTVEFSHADIYVIFSVI